MTHLVTTQWLADHLDDADLAIIDASWHLPTTKRNASEEFSAAHIPGAGFYDLDAGADPTSTLPHMLPRAEKFSSDLRALGVRQNGIVVVYDSVGLFSAARLWWMLKSFGHHNAFVLDGGLVKWRAENHPLEQGIARVRNSGTFTATLDQSQVKGLRDVKTGLDTNASQIVDARSPTRFRGEEPEPRPGVRPGHMAGAKNVHYATLLNSDGTMKQHAELTKVFAAANLDTTKPIIASCGSGVTAAILILGLSELGITHTSLYDGSWAEWGGSSEPVVTGPS